MILLRNQKDYSKLYISERQHLSKAMKVLNGVFYVLTLNLVSD